MKKLFFLLIMMMPFIALAQERLSVVTLKNGTVLKGVIKSIDPAESLTIVISGIETTISMDNVAIVESNITTSANINEPLVELQAVPLEDPLKDYKGFLLEKGNNVYIYYANSDGDKNAKYDKEGATVIKTLLKRDGFWNVVDNMNQAHFTINYCVITKGADKSALTISSWRTGKIHFLANESTNEEITKNNVVAQHFYKKAIKSLQNKIEKGKISKKMREDFTIK